MDKRTTTIPAGGVVVGVDSSDHSEHALDWAADQSAREGRPLVIVCAVRPWPDIWPGPTAPITPIPGAVEAATTLAEHATRRAHARHPGLDIQRHIAVGDARQVLTDLSATADTLVLGSRGRGIFASLLGSVSASLARHAACPVVITRPAHHRLVRHGVVVGADGTSGSLPVIEYAFRQASFLSLPLTVMHCYWNAVPGVPVRSQDTADMEEMRALLSESVAGLREKFPDVHVSTELSRGLVDECLTRHTQGWDLIVVGHHSHSGISRFLAGSMATAVLERATTTVAVVPETEPVERRASTGADS